MLPPTNPPTTPPPAPPIVLPTPTTAPSIFLYHKERRLYRLHPFFIHQRRLYRLRLHRRLWPVLSTSDAATLWTSSQKIICVHPNSSTSFTSYIAINASAVAAAYAAPNRKSFSNANTNSTLDSCAATHRSTGSSNNAMPATLPFVWRQPSW